MLSVGTEVMDPFLELVFSVCSCWMFMGYVAPLFLAVFYLHSAWWYQMWSSLLLILLLGENPACSMDISAKDKGLEKS